MISPAILGVIAAKKGSGGGGPTPAVGWSVEDKGSDITLTNGGLTASNPTDSFSHAVAGISKNSGKWYAEFTIDELDASNDCYIGWIEAPMIAGDTSRDLRFVDALFRRVAWRSSSVYYGESVISAGIGYTVGDVVMVAVDFATGNVWFGKNGTWNASGNPAAGTGAQVNFPLAFAQSSTFGFGPDNEPGVTTVTAKFSAPFTYSVPSGFSGF